MSHATLAFAGTTLQVAMRGERAVAVVKLLFERLQRAAAEPPARPTLHVEAREHGRLALLDAGAAVVALGSEGEVAEVLQSEVSRLLIDGNHDGLMVHAGLVATAEGAGLLLPAASGSGKSTLTAFLLAHDYTHLSDELAYAPAGPRTVLGYPRALELKRPSLALIRRWFRRAPDARSLLPTPAGAVVHHELLTDRSAERCDVRAVVFPRYQAGAPCVLSPLSSAETAARLLQCTLNARHLAGGGLPLAAALARGARGFSLGYGDLEGVAALLRGCVD